MSSTAFVMMMIVLLSMVVSAISSACADGEQEIEQPIPYIGGPMLQDMRLIGSFAMGIFCMHVAETSRANNGDGQRAIPQRKFEMYPYAL